MANYIERVKERHEQDLNGEELAGATVVYPPVKYPTFILTFKDGSNIPLVSEKGHQPDIPARAWESRQSLPPASLGDGPHLPGGGRR
jgi:hypothetical protein